MKPQLKLVRCSDCQWCVGALDLASGLNAGFAHSDATQHSLERVSVYAMNNRPKPNGEMTMAKKELKVKVWWQLSEIETVLGPSATAKLGAYFAAKHPPVTANSPRQPKPGKPAKPRAKGQSAPKLLNVVEPTEPGSRPAPANDQG